MPDHIVVGRRENGVYLNRSKNGEYRLMDIPFRRVHLNADSFLQAHGRRKKKSNPAPTKKQPDAKKPGSQDGQRKVGQDRAVVMPNSQIRPMTQEQFDKLITDSRLNWKKNGRKVEFRSPLEDGETVDGLDQAKDKYVENADGLHVYYDKQPSNEFDLESVRAWARENGYHEVTFSNVTNVHAFLNPRQYAYWKAAGLGNEGEQFPPVIK